MLRVHVHRKGRSVSENAKENLIPYALIGAGTLSFVVAMFTHRRGFGRMFFPMTLEAIMTCGLVMIALFTVSVLLKSYKWIEFGEPPVAAVKFGGIAVLCCGLMVWLPMWMVVAVAAGVFGLVYWLFELTDKETLPWLGTFAGAFIVSWFIGRALMAYA
jgi:hypothetical protein